MAHSKLLVNQWRNAPSSSDQLGHQLAFTKSAQDVDDYGEIWINGECDRERGAIQGFNVPQRVLITTDPQPGQAYKIALLAANGPLAAPGGSVFVRYALLAFEWCTPGYSHVDKGQPTWAATARVHRCGGGSSTSHGPQ